MKRTRAEQKARRAKYQRKAAAAAAPDPSRNVGIARGEAVTSAEMSGYGYVLCQRGCRGTGLVGPGKACICSTRRFLKAHPEVIVDRMGMCWWPAKRREDEGLVVLEKEPGFPR